MLLFIRYLCALFYDLVIVVTLFFTLTALLVLCNKGHVIPPGALWYQLALLAILYSYFFLSYRYGGQTIGLRAWHMKLETLNMPISPIKIGLRLIIALPVLVLRPFLMPQIERMLKKWTGTYLVQIQ